MNHSCDKPIGLSRRDLLRAGVATFMGLAVRDLVAFGDTSQPAKADHVVLIWLSGGISHIDTFDPKPGRPVAGEFAPIKTSVPGIEISEILPNLAKQMKHGALVRSIAGTEGAHERAAYHLQTNYRPTPQMVHPTMGSIVAHELERTGDLPSFVSIGERALSSGYLGHRCEAYYVGAPGQPDPYLVLPPGVTEAREQRRLAALAQANDGFKSRSSDAELKATTDTQQAALRFMKSPALAAFDLNKEPAAVRAAYGDSAFGKGCLLARRLVDQGVRFVQVTTGGFDTHYQNFNALRRLAPTVDQAVAALVSDLAASGKLQRTMILTLSEFGRSPKINDNAGREHHPHAFSSFMAGGGIKPGTLIGASDADGHEVAERPVTPGDIHATLCHALGIDGTKTVDTPLGRPMRLVDRGEAVTELFA